MPSTGVPTAAYDASVAFRSASTITAALRSSGVAAPIRRMIARSISLRITPELPRAPSSAPRVNASRVAARSARGSPGLLAHGVAGGGHRQVEVGPGVAVGTG